MRRVCDSVVAAMAAPGVRLKLASPMTPVGRDRRLNLVVQP